MGFLNNLKQLLGDAARPVDSRMAGAIREVNPFDNNRTYSNPQGTVTGPSHNAVNYPITLPGASSAQHIGNTGYVQNPQVPAHTLPIRNISEDGPALQGGLNFSYPPQSVQSQQPIFPQQPHPFQVQDNTDITSNAVAYRRFQPMPYLSMPSFATLVNKAGQ